MKTFALAALLCGLTSSAFAACPVPLTGKDAAGATQNFDVITDSTGNNCIGSIVLSQPTNSSAAAWTSATTVNTNIDIPFSGRFPAVLVRMTTATATFTTGAITFRQKGPDGVYTNAPVAKTQNADTLAPLTNPFPIPVSSAFSQDYVVINTGGYTINVDLTTALTGAGTLTVSYTLVPYSPEPLALTFPLAAGSAIIGKVGVDQTTPGTTNGVTIAPDSGTVTAGTTTVAGTTASNLVVKASAGNLQNVYVDSSAAGWVFLINATSLPANATLTIGTASGNLQGCFELPKANTEWVGSQNYNPGPWEHFSTGITVAISSTSCPVLTAASTGKFIHAQAN